MDRRFLPFRDAREYVHNLGIPNEKAWRKYCTSGIKPKDIPSKPDFVYRGKEWIDWYDWLGTRKEPASSPEGVKYDFRSELSTKKGRAKYLPFTQAREYLRKLGLRDTKEWYRYLKSGKRPDNIPAHPDRIYEGNWVDWYDWLGTRKGFVSFIDAREYIRELRLPNEKAWRKYCTSGKKPKDIPSTPNIVYRGEKGWNGLRDFLGIRKSPKMTKNQMTPITYVSYAEAKTHAREKKISTYSQRQKYCKSGERPDNIPSHPEIAYIGKGWTDWPDFFGTRNVAFYNREYIPFAEAKAHAREKNFRSRAQWEQYCKSGDKPDNIPSRPDVVYEHEGWTNISDFLGTGNIATQQTGWTINKVKELLRALIESRMIQTWNEVDLYSLLHTKGLLNLHDDNRHSQFFKKLLEASHTEKGREAIESYAYSQNHDEDIPDLISQEYSEEIQTAASNEEIARLVNTDETQSDDPSDYGEIRTVNEILSSTKIESINVDEETMKFFVVGRIADLWKRTFREGAKGTTALQIKSEGRNGNKFHDEIIDTYLAEYEAITAIKTKLPNSYAFPKGDPTLMQLYTAYKIKRNPYFGNFSGTGAGKTLSAVLASRVIDSKVSIIVCPNDVVEQWKNGITEAFPASNVITGKEAFYLVQDKNNYNYLVLNYDKFSQDDSPNLILNLVKQNRIDFVILDEIHFSKVRSAGSKASSIYELRIMVDQTASHLP